MTDIDITELEAAAPEDEDLEGLAAEAAPAEDPGPEDGTPILTEEV